MNSREYPAAGAPLPKKENQLQGPRPQPRKVSKDSHKIKKSPPPHQHNRLHRAPPGKQREPMIIYSVPPRVIHVTPENFKDLVQRLTGLPARGDVSPAARVASIEKTSPTKREREKVSHNANDNNVTWMLEKGVEVGQYPGILLPEPETLPPFPAEVFSPARETQMAPYWNEFSSRSPTQMAPYGNEFWSYSPTQTAPYGNEFWSCSPTQTAPFGNEFRSCSPMQMAPYGNEFWSCSPTQTAPFGNEFRSCSPMQTAPYGNEFWSCSPTQTGPYWNEFWSCNPTQTAPSSASLSVPVAPPQPSPNLFSHFDYQ